MVWLSMVSQSKQRTKPKLYAGSRKTSRATAAIHAGQLLRMRDFFDIHVAGDAFEGRMGGRFQGGRIETRGHSSLAFPDTRAGIVAAGTVLGMQLRRLLAAEAGGQHGRNGSDPE